MRISSSTLPSSARTCGRRWLKFQHWQMDTISFHKSVGEPSARFSRTYPDWAFYSVEEILDTERKSWFRKLLGMLKTTANIRKKNRVHFCAGSDPSHTMFT